MKHIFGTGTARGGTGLVVQTLRAHSDIELAMEPFLSLFKSYRAQVVNSLMCLPEAKLESINNPIGAIYFEQKASIYLDKILKAPDDFNITRGEFRVIIDGILGRAAYDAEDLIPFIKNVSGSTYSEMVASLTKIIAQARGREDVKWCGFMENWCIEFFPFLADFFPNSKFFIILRDPRAVVCSALNAPVELQSTFLSYIRALRKLFDLALHYLVDPRFKNRLCVVKFESLVANPSHIASELCQFFNVNYEKNMTDPRYHVIPGTNETRDGVSSFEEKAVGYSESRIHRWKSILPDTLVKLVNALMEEEMKIFGYLDRNDNNKLNMNIILEGLQNPNMKIDNPKWSTDLPSFTMNYGPEIIRRDYLSKVNSRMSFDDNIISELYLSQNIFDLLKSENNKVAPSPEWSSFSNIIKV